MRPIFPLVLATACNLPRVAEEPDLPGSVLSGTLLVESDVDGTGIVLMSSIDNPQPPIGTGTPVSFTTLPATSFEAGSAGTRAARFALTDVPAGGWYLFGLVDFEGDFHPGVTALATPGCGDAVGWLLDRPGGVPTAVEVGELELVDALVLGPLRVLDEPRPVFTVPGDTSVADGAVVRLSATSVTASFAGILLDVPGPTSATPCRSGFRFVRNDADGDGDADSSPLLPLFEDRFPRVVFRWLGVPDGQGGFDRGDVGDDVTIAAIGDPVPLGTLPEPGVAIDVDTLDVTWTGFGQRIEPDGTSAVLAGPDLPAGAWSTTLITASGQLWTLPNEIGPGFDAALPPPGRESEADPAQGVVLLR